MRLTSKSIAYKPNTVVEEGLPFPIVLYPGHYGTFFAFRKNVRSIAYFCSCAYEAIENYIKLRKLSPITQNAYKDKMYVLSSSDFPLSIVEALMKRNVPADAVLGHLKFAEKLCHECNLQTPALRYCHEMYGGVFKQNYGWYINKQGFEWGLDRWKSEVFIPEACPDDLAVLVGNAAFKEMRARMGYLNGKMRDLDSEVPSVFRERAALSKKISKELRRINGVIENEVRRKFGHKRIGEAWTSETILYYIIKKLFPKYNILRHYRPSFLRGLELDIYIEDLGIGIEYQGIQHYKPIRHWGGEESLIKLRERDRRKKKLCKDNATTLVCFRYDEGLSEDFVLQKLRGEGA